MPHTDVIIIGGGQAGLAMSHCLSERAIAHVVLERGRVGERWRAGSWDSLRLLTPNWMARLPGADYDGPDPDGFMPAGEFAGRLETYAEAKRAPVQCATTVLSVERAGGRYYVTTDRGVWTAPSVVVATGSCDLPLVPRMARCLPGSIHQLTPNRYQVPHDLPSGGVLVVGASASGLQLAQEIHRSGRPVTLAVGAHTRLPRRYRGRDIFWWLDRVGVLDQRAEHVPDIDAARRQPSLQLVGDTGNRTLDLGTLRTAGVTLRGRLAAIEGASVSFAGDLAETMRDADRRLVRLLARIDAFAERNGLQAQTQPAERVQALVIPQSATSLHLANAGIRTVLWATGFYRRYPWLRVPVLDAEGEIAHEGGVTVAPGLYALGLRFMRRRRSSYIDGCGQDAQELAGHVAAALKAAGRRAA